MKKRKDKLSNYSGIRNKKPDKKAKEALVCAKTQNQEKIDAGTHEWVIGPCRSKVLRKIE